MIKPMLTVAALSLVTSQAFAADCPAPEVPTLPDGKTSTMEQMIAGQKSVKQFQASAAEYRSCLEEISSAAEAATKSGSDENKKAAMERYNKSIANFNEAVSQEEELAKEFNDQIKAYTAANPN